MIVRRKVTVVLTEGEAKAVVVMANEGQIFVEQKTHWGVDEPSAYQQRLAVTAVEKIEEAIKQRRKWDPARRKPRGSVSVKDRLSAVEFAKEVARRTRQQRNAVTNTAHVAGVEDGDNGRMKLKVQRRKRLGRPAKKR